MKPLIIGFGNPLRCDDGFGWHAAQQLRRHYGPGDARVIAAHQLQPEMAETIAAASVVIFIDAEQGSAPGRVACRPVQPRAEAPRSFTHDLSPGALVTCARLLYHRAPPAFLVTVSGAEFDAGESMSQAVVSALPMVALEIDHLLRTSAPQ